MLFAAAIEVGGALAHARKSRFCLGKVSRPSEKVSVLLCLGSVQEAKIPHIEHEMCALVRVRTSSALFSP